MRCHFRAPVATDGQHGDPLAFGRGGEGMEYLRRHAEDDVDGRVHKRGINANRARTRPGMAGEIVADRGQNLGPRRGQRLDDPRALDACVRLLRE